MLSHSKRIPEWWTSLPLGKKRVWSGFILAVLVIPIALFPFHRINITTSPSLKSRVHWLCSDVKALNRGDIVMFEHANAATKFKKARLTKIMACVEGDRLEVKGFKEYYCNGTYLGRAKDTTLEGEPMVHFDFNGIIPPGKVFVFGQHKDSYDSRYIGFLDRSSIIGRVVPVF